jgi:hypothetical protein
MKKKNFFGGVESDRRSVTKIAGSISQERIKTCMELLKCLEIMSEVFFYFVKKVSREVFNISKSFYLSELWR